MMLRGYSRLAASGINRMVRVTDVTLYLFCPRKLYLVGFLGIRGRPTRESIMGKLAHYAYLRASILKITEDRVEEESVNIAREAVEKKLTEGLSDTEVKEIVVKTLRFRAENPIAGGVEVEKYVESVRLGLNGQIDLMEEHTPVEVKYKSRAEYRDLIQLTLYTLLLEDVYGWDIDYGYIDLLKASRRLRIEVNNRLRGDALKLRDKVQETILMGTYPPARDKCRGCDLKIECRSLFH